MGIPAHDFIKFCLNLKCSPKRLYNPCVRGPPGYETEATWESCSDGWLSVLPGQGTMGAMQGCIRYFIFMRPFNN